MEGLQRGHRPAKWNGWDHFFFLLFLFFFWEHPSRQNDQSESPSQHPLLQEAIPSSPIRAGTPPTEPLQHSCFSGAPLVDHLGGELASPAWGEASGGQGARHTLTSLQHLYQHVACNVNSANVCGIDSKRLFYLVTVSSPFELDNLWFLGMIIVLPQTGGEGYLHNKCTEILCKNLKSLSSCLAVFTVEGISVWRSMIIYYW